MRLTCPNCDAQYRVPDTAIPTGGRDVECSGCGKTWFQHHPDHPPHRTVGNTGAGQPAATPTQPAPGIANDGGTSAGPEHPAEDGQAMEPVHRELAPEVVEILRQEAERESRLRARHRPANLECQPELGLDSMGLDLSAPPPRKPAVSETAGTRTDSRTADAVLPDTDALSSTLRDAGPGISGGTAANDPQAPPASSRGGFFGGFGLVAAFALVLALLYGNSDRIIEKLPQSAPMVHAYVDKVDQGRLWLDSKISSYSPR